MSDKSPRSSSPVRVGPLVWRRLRLKRADGVIYQERWGIELALGDNGYDRTLAAIYIHRYRAPDPGRDLHDHPWPMASFKLWGGYDEIVASTRDMLALARFESTSLARVVALNPRKPLLPANEHLESISMVRRPWLSWHTMGRDRCHQIVKLHRPTVWTVVLRGARSRPWGFYTEDGWVEKSVYDRTVRVERRDLWAEPI